ncbi:MAG: hypothetical protein Q8910_00850 [Bacteroidota bacterium]|nr:hypothetical protein [Bacteroidota bacterium]
MYTHFLIDLGKFDKVDETPTEEHYHDPEFMDDWNDLEGESSTNIVDENHPEMCDRDFILPKENVSINDIKDWEEVE